MTIIIITIIFEAGYIYWGECTELNIYYIYSVEHERNDSFV